MREPKKILVSAIFLLTCTFGSLALRSFEGVYAMEQNDCESASEYMLELLEIEERAFRASAECFPTSTNLDCIPGNMKELVNHAEALRKKVIETAHRCLKKKPILQGN